MYLGMYLFSVFISSISQILLKKGALKKYTHFLGDYLNPYVIGGYGLLFVSMFLTMLAFKGVDLKMGPIIEATSYIYVAIMSYIFLKERISKRKKIGLLVILIGIVVAYIA